MRALIQRVKKASVEIENDTEDRSIGQGLLVLIGIEHEDKLEDADYLLQKITQLRIFSDAEGKMNLSLKDIQGSILVVSQFTLFASTKKGNRPSFIQSAGPETAIPLYEYFLKHLNDSFEFIVKSGIFGADMQVSLVNDGPVTILIDSKNKE
ncbi:MAG: D-aminoacyl-tRNA deacylase [Bacteroidota bacterium]